MPLTGLISFPQHNPSTIDRLFIVSMPSYGLQSFLRNFKLFRKHRAKVSMPSYGLQSFLLKATVPKDHALCVSMPSYGLQSFLREIEEMFIHLLKEFQCPLTGFNHFYGILLKALLYEAFKLCFCRYLSEFSEK